MSFYMKGKTMKMKLYNTGEYRCVFRTLAIKNLKIKYTVNLFELFYTYIYIYIYIYIYFIPMKKYINYQLWNAVLMFYQILTTRISRIV